ALSGCGSGFGSGLLLLALAVLVSVLPAFALTFTTRVRVALWPPPSVPTLQLTVPLLPLGLVSVPTPGLRVALGKEAPAGSGSVSTTLCAGWDPVFVTTSV